MLLKGNFLSSCTCRISQLEGLVQLLPDAAVHVVEGAVEDAADILVLGHLLPLHWMGKGWIEGKLKRTVFVLNPFITHYLYIEL